MRLGFEECIFRKAGRVGFQKVLRRWEEVTGLFCGGSFGALLFGMTPFPWGLIPRPSGVVATVGAEDLFPRIHKALKNESSIPCCSAAGCFIKSGKNCG